MALDLKVGSFTLDEVTATQVVTGVGFTPKLVIFWSQDSVLEAGDKEDPGRIIIGFSDGTNERSIAVNSGRANVEGVPVTNTRRLVSSSALVGLAGGPSVFKWEFGIDSFDSDGFTLAFSHLVANGNAADVFYMALGGTDVEDIAIGSFDGTQGLPRQEITGLGFRPEFLMVLGASSPTGLDDLTVQLENGSFSLGMATKLNQYSTGVRTVDDVFLSNTTSTMREEFISLFSDDLSLLEAQATLRSLDSDGFTLDWTRSVTAYRYFYLAIKGPRFKVGTDVTPVVATNKSVIGTGFLPQGLFSVANGVFATLPAMASGIAYAFGGADATSSFNTVYSDPNGRIPETAQRERQDSLVVIQNNAGFNRAIGSLLEFSVNGFVLNWGIADPPSLRFGYMAIGSKIDVAGITLAYDNIIQLTDVGASIDTRSVVHTIVWSDIAAEGDRLQIGESSVLGTRSNMLLSASSSGHENTLVFPFDGVVFSKGLQVTRLDSGKLFVYVQRASQTPTFITLVDAGDLTIVAAPGAGLSIYVTQIFFSTTAAGANTVGFREGFGGVYKLRTFLSAASAASNRESFSPPWKLPANTSLVGNMADGMPDVYVTVQFFIAP